MSLLPSVSGCVCRKKESFNFYKQKTNQSIQRSDAVFPHLKRTVEVSGEFDQLLLHRLADGTPVTVQSHAVHQQETEERQKSLNI